MVDENFSHGDQPETLGIAPPRGATQSLETASVMVLPLPAFFLVQRIAKADQPERPVLLTTSQYGLQSLQCMQDIRSIWLVLVADDGLTMEFVDRLCLWRMPPKRGDGYLTALLCESGAIFVADCESVYEADETTRKWFARGNIKCERDQQDTFSIDAVVVAKHPTLGVATVRSDDGNEYLMSRHTNGLTFDAVDEGMRLLCVVSPMPSVLSASMPRQINKHAPEYRPTAQGQTEHG